MDGEPTPEGKPAGGASALATEADALKPRGKASLPWVEKYRPKGLGDLIAHDHIISTSEPARAFVSMCCACSSNRWFRRIPSTTFDSSHGNATPTPLLAAFDPF